MSQVPCARSKATAGSLTALYVPPAKMVIPVSRPFCQVTPPSVEVAKPMSEAPPSKKRPIWKTATSVEPKAATAGSTSVACWLDGFEKVSVLSLCSSGGGLLEPPPVPPEFDSELDPDPHASIANNKDAALPKAVHFEANRASNPIPIPSLNRTPTSDRGCYFTTNGYIDRSKI